MSTPSSSSAATPGRLPVGKYLLSLPAFVVAFLALGIVDQWLTVRAHLSAGELQREVGGHIAGRWARILSAVGLSRPDTAMASPQDRMASGEGAEAKRLVLELNYQMEAAFRTGAPPAAGASPVSPSLAGEIAADIAFSRSAGEPALAAEVLEVLDVAPRDGGGWSVVTKEAWRPAPPQPAPGGSFHSRYRYTIAAEGGRLRIEEMVPILPEPPRAPDR